jgi:hypothetical protein
MEFIAFELYSLIIFPTLSIGGEDGVVYPFTTTFQTSNLYACKKILIHMLQKEQFFPSNNSVPFLVNSPCLSMIYLPLVILFLKEPALIPIVIIFNITERGVGVN